jgi:peptidoglycan hydrolase CwlO-like protein
MLMSEYIHNDDLADMLYAKDQEIEELTEQVAKLEKRIETIRTTAFYAIEELLTNGF